MILVKVRSIRVRAVSKLAFALKCESWKGRDNVLELDIASGIRSRVSLNEAVVVLDIGSSWMDIEYLRAAHAIDGLEERSECSITEVSPFEIGGEHYAGSTQFVQRISCLSDSFPNIWEGYNGIEPESLGIRSTVSRGLLIDEASKGYSGCFVARENIGGRSGEREDGLVDTLRVHEVDVTLQVPDRCGVAACNGNHIAIPRRRNMT